MVWIVGLALLVIVVTLALAQRHTYVLQYLFFCRFPLVVGLLLFAVLPSGMVWWADTSLGNLAVLDPIFVGLVALLATATAWAVLLATARLLNWIPRYADLWFYREEDRPVHGAKRNLLRWFDVAAERVVAGIYETILGTKQVGKVDLKRLALCILLALPLISVTVWRSTELALDTDNSSVESVAGRLGLNVLAAVVGIAVAYLFRIAGAKLTKWLFAPESWFHAVFNRAGPVRSAGVLLHKKASEAVVNLDKNLPAGFSRRTGLERDELLKRTAGGLGFFVIAGFIFLCSGFFLNPARSESGPALAVVLMALLVILFLLSLASAFADKLRVPVVLLLVAVTFSLFHIFGIDHYYEVGAAAENDVSQVRPPVSPEGVYQRWRKLRSVEQHPTPVIVTCSGGGITAALWTAEVLTKLQEQRGFGRSLVALSTVSGGGVGAMYFVDRYEHNDPPSDAACTFIKEAAGKSSLLATSWGFAYKDIWWSLPIWSRTKDRGHALERAWRERLHEEHRFYSLRSVQRKLEEDWRPVQIFNATAVETGGRFLLAAMNLPPRPASSTTGMTGEENAGGLEPCDGDSSTDRIPWDAQNFLDLYPKSDLNIVTAARLSATFPFVSPISRPEKGAVPEADAYHLADGGYYDNHGVATAIDFLRDVLPLVAAERQTESQTDSTGEGRAATGPLPKVLLIQIRVRADEKSEPSQGSAYLMATLGPVKALMNVRTASQIARNETEIQLLKEAWRSRVEVVPMVFELKIKDAPLSWHLSSRDKKNISEGWKQEHIDRARCVGDLLGG